MPVTLASELGETETVIRQGISTTCTHVIYGFNYMEGNESPIRSFKVSGILDGDGLFVPIGPPEYADFSQSDYEDLLEESEVSAAGDFAMSEIVALHDSIHTQNVVDRLARNRV